MNKDTLTTIIGGAGAAITAAQPVINAVDGSFSGPDGFKLATAIVFGLLGFFTNKQ